MPNAPRRRSDSKPPDNRMRLDRERFRGTAHSRGYTGSWNEYAANLCLERIFCELCMAIGIETPIVRERGKNETGRRRKIVSVVDHIIPVIDGQNDPLFWETWNHWCLCVACDRWKSATFDGGYGRDVRPVARTRQGANQRRLEVITERGGGSKVCELRL